jgi:hypothetical protein
MGSAIDQRWSWCRGPDEAYPSYIHTYIHIYIYTYIHTYNIVEQRTKTVLFFSETRSAVVTQRRFRVHFQTRWAPSFKIIHKLYNRFNNDGSVLARKRRQPSSVLPPENIDAIKVALQKRPSKSTRKADLNPCNYFFGDSLRKKFFRKSRKQ